MQISSISFSSSIPMGKTTSSSAAKPPADQAVINFSADSFSSLVDEAAQQPEVRSNLVASFKAQIQSGQYPTQSTISSLVDAIGGGVLQMAKSGSSSQEL